MKETLKAPVQKLKKRNLTIHGDSRIDNYYWLNQRENPEVIEYLEEENAYTKAMMGHTDSLQSKLFNEIVGRIKQTDISVPYLKMAIIIIPGLRKARNIRSIAGKRATSRHRKK